VYKFVIKDILEILIHKTVFLVILHVKHVLDQVKNNVKHVQMVNSLLIIYVFLNVCKDITN